MDGGRKAKKAKKKERMKKGDFGTRSEGDT